MIMIWCAVIVTVHVCSGYMEMQIGDYCGRLDVSPHAFLGTALGQTS